jgi:hypothetical protein
MHERRTVPLLPRGPCDPDRGLRPLGQRRAGRRRGPGRLQDRQGPGGGRLQQELARLQEAGAEADGEVVDPNPIDAIRKLASREEIDEVVVSTLPRRLSRWMAMDRPHRVRRATKLPVTHISGPAGPSL